MSDTSTQRDPVEELADAFAVRIRRGESPSIDAYAAEHPEHAHAIRELFPAVVEMERLKSHQLSSRDGRSTIGGRPLEQLGDFRIIGPIGRGGMGVVYEAEQESLGRRVALKVLPQSMLLTDQQIARFRREARTAARLHHTNIVPVFGFGEHDGLHYYVMQLIQGVGLDAVIPTLSDHERDSNDGKAWFDRTHQLVSESADMLQQGPTQVGETPSSGQRHLDLPTGQSVTSFCRRVAFLGWQAANALAYSHGAGVLHRDIKPANMLLEPSGRLWLADFGLARASGEADLTEGGSLSGTLRFMPPEQLAGQFDERSDLFSLGLSLYELLTLTPAFSATSQSKLLHEIAERSPTPPRAIDARIPRDLDTVIRKAVAREPNDRYASAQAFADDLARFINDQPVGARRISPVQRIWRWSKRRPAVAALSLTAVTLLMATTFVVIGAWWMTSSANRRMEVALQGETRQRERAEQSVLLATETLDRVFERLAPGHTGAVLTITVEDESGEAIDVYAPPVLSERSAALLVQLLPYYDRLAKIESDNTQLRRKTADAIGRVGDIRHQLGQLTLADSSYRSALAAWKAIQSESPQDASASVRMARIENQLGVLYRSTRQADEAVAAHERALALLTTSDVVSESDGLDYELARTHYLIGRPAEPAILAHRPSAPREPNRGGPRPPGHELGRGGDLLPPRDDARPRPHSSKPGPGPFMERDFIGLFGKPDKSGPRPMDRVEQTLTPVQRDKKLAHLAGAIRLLESKADANERSRLLLASCHRAAAQLLLPDRRDEAAQALVAAREVLESLSEHHPDSPDLQCDLADTFAMTLHVVRHGEERDRVERDIRRAVQITDKLANDYPGVPRYTAAFVQHAHRLVRLLRERQDWNEVLELLRKASQRQGQLAARFSNHTAFQMWHALVLVDLADAHGKLKNWTEYRSCIDRASMTLDRLAKTPSSDTSFPENLAIELRSRVDRQLRRLTDRQDRKGRPERGRGLR